MRILRLLPRLFVLLLMAATILAPVLASAHASPGRERPLATAAMDHHAHPVAQDHEAMGHATVDHAATPHEQAHGHSPAPSDEAHDEAPLAPCSAGCCVTGMACCTAVLAEPAVVRTRSAERIVRASVMSALSGLDPDVPLKPPRALR